MTREEKTEGQTLWHACLQTLIHWEDSVKRYRVREKGRKKVIIRLIPTTSAKAEITFPNVVRDLLMFAPSCNHTKYIFVNHQDTF